MTGKHIIGEQGQQRQGHDRVTIQPAGGDEGSRRAVRELMSYKFAIDEHAIVAVTDVRGRITFTNDRFCQISGYSRDELIGQDHRILNSGHHPKSFFTAMYRTISAGRTWRGDIKNRAKNGSHYWVHTTIVPFKDSQGRVEQYVAIRADITDLKRAEEALREMHDELERRVAQRTADLEAVNAALQEREDELRRAKEHAEAASLAKSAFLANMSHEIRTPLTAIFGFTDLLLTPNQPPSERLACVQTIRRNGEHLLAVINDILDVSKIEAGKMDVRFDRTSLVEILAGIASTMQQRAVAKGLTLRIVQGGPLPETIITDDTRLRQVLFNLVGNAIKFTERGEVTVTTTLVEGGGSKGREDHPPRLRIAVADTGIGLTPEQQSALFEPFCQVDASHARRFGGTGLGLTICKRLTELLNGQIQVESRAGIGSTFTVTVPTGDLTRVRRVEGLADFVLKPLPTTPAQTPVRLSGRVLLADDSPDNQALIALRLRQVGLEVEVAENGREAVAKAIGAAARAQAFDLILMDMQMPEMDGYAATMVLRERGHRGPIIALTANAMDHDRRRSLSVGCDHFLTKPIQLDSFFRVLRSYLRSDVSIGTDARVDESAKAGVSAGPGDHLVSAFARDAIVAPMLERFLDNLRQSVDDITRCVSNGEVGRASRVAHRIKGSAGSYGFPDITRAAAAVEHAAVQGQPDETLRAVVGELQELCNRARRGHRA